MNVCVRFFLVMVLCLAGVDAKEDAVKKVEQPALSLYDDRAREELKAGAVRWVTLTQDHREEVKMGLPKSAVPEQIDWEPSMERGEAYGNEMRRVLIFHSDGERRLRLLVPETRVHDEVNGDEAAQEAMFSKAEAEVRMREESYRMVVTSCSRTMVGDFPALLVRVNEETTWRVGSTNIQGVKVVLWVFTRRHWVPMELSVSDVSLEQAQKVLEAEMPGFLATAATMKVKSCGEFPQSFRTYLDEQYYLVIAWARSAWMMEQLEVVKERYPALKREALAAGVAWYDSPFATGSRVLGEMIREREGPERAEELRQWASRSHPEFNSDPIATKWFRGDQRSILWNPNKLFSLDSEENAKVFLAELKKQLQGNPPVSGDPDEAEHEDYPRWCLSAYHPRYRNQRLLEMKEGVVRKWWVPFRTLEEGKLTKWEWDLTTPLSFHHHVYRGECLWSALSLNFPEEGEDTLNPGMITLFYSPVRKELDVSPEGMEKLLSQVEAGARAGLSSSTLSYLILDPASSEHIKLLSCRRVVIQKRPAVLCTWPGEASVYIFAGHSMFTLHFSSGVNDVTQDKKMPLFLEIMNTLEIKAVRSGK